jgi:hypothetical protein
MTPTRYPGWRFFGFLISINNALSAVVAIHMTLSGGATSIETVGWVTKGAAPSDPRFLTFLFCMSLGVAGGLLSIKNPGRGFALIGASYAAGVLCLLWHFPLQLNRWPVYALVGGVGLLYLHLGIRQLEIDRA